MVSKKLLCKCKFCSNEFWAYNTSHGPQIFCSKKCNGNFQLGKKLNVVSKKKTFNCSNCKNKFQRYIVKTRPQLFCSRKCFLISKLHRNMRRAEMTSRNLVGNKNPSWKGGKSSLGHRIRNAPQYYQWRTVGFERDNFTCIKCGIKGGMLNFHHKNSMISIIVQYSIKSIKDALNCVKLWDLDNGITLCRNCHTKAHIEADGAFYNKKLEELTAT